MDDFVVSQLIIASFMPSFAQLSGGVIALVLLLLVIIAIRLVLPEGKKP